MNVIKFFAIAIAVILMTSCTKTEDETSGLGDALIVSKKSGENTVYGVSLYAYSFSAFQSVKAVSIADPGKTYTLKANQTYKTNFIYETPEADFSTTKPEASTYNFSAVFENGITQEFQDILSDKVLLPASIDTCEYISATHLLKLSWVDVADADSYAINIMDGSTLVFSTPQLLNTRTSYLLSASGSGWSNNFIPVSGKTYTVRIFAFLFESDQNSYNVQATSVSDETVVWGN